MADASLAAILANLEAQIVFRRDREAFHSQQESHHRQKKELHAAELELLTRSLETFRAAVESAMELTRRAGAAGVLPVPAPDPDPGRRPRLSRMVALTVESWPAGEPFGYNAITAEVNRRYRDRLRRPADARMVSLHLRRLLAAGVVDSVRQGRPHHEALYRRRG